MRTPKWSSAAVAISTIESESTSRSSMNDLGGVTSPTGTPAISFTIWARPARMSCSVMVLFSLDGAEPYGSGVSRNADDWAGIGEPCSEREQHHGVATGEIPGCDEPRQ